jgi:hypothetical protein
VSETNYFTPFLCVEKEPFVMGKEGVEEVIIGTVVLG